ncbi:hypothetical protein [Promicromonospora sp. NPDC090134]|uniref:hypothetical protein n=1 Tax=Promicromonospora sp. NPDC090134 TaxID=3364408 RepID=UPI00380B32EF
MFGLLSGAALASRQAYWTVAVRTRTELVSIVDLPPTHGPHERPPLHFPYEGRTFDDPDHATDRADLLWRLTQWMLRAQDELPTGAYTAKRAPHNWVFDAGTADPDAGTARAHAR